MDRPQLKQTTYSRQREQKHHHYSEAESFSFLSGLLRAVLSIALIVGATVFAYGKFKEYQNRQQLARQAPSLMDAASTQTADTRFRCDGRQHCSQMTSCEEAKFFMNNCPGTKMDGDGDGIPCEEQWCAGFLR